MKGACTNKKKMSQKNPQTRLSIEIRQCKYGYSSFQYDFKANSIWVHAVVKGCMHAHVNFATPTMHELCLFYSHL